MPVRRIDQQLAVAAADALPNTITPGLRTRYRQLRIMLHSAGLAASYAFIASKVNDQGADGAAYALVAEGIKRRLSSLRLLTGAFETLTPVDVLRQLGQMEPVVYARASAEAAALVSWLSRLANAVGVDDSEEENAEDDHGAA